MKETVSIEYGTDNWLSKIGLLLILVAIVIFVITLYILGTGKNLPIDASIFHYGTIIPQHVYFFFPGSLVLGWIGSKVSDIKKWTETDFDLFENGIEFDWEGQVVKLKKEKILKITYKKLFLSKKLRVQIKTIGIKSYLLRMNRNDSEILFNAFKDSLFKETPFGLQKINVE
ncbi:hypothetical protein [Allomuricauda sp. NBRC 101325]|uniref:hypothetical protein n=1 Tax=Allomuricauda sp. NBRC 101325 TaxID=1113758 RepID=UPI0024A22A54|nr:hypothetical protein [Muricauda sp. NBRC 101325]GLU44850.1 hypothetical protein Musp01_24740 [Muricauda sp. NBRC 101325]